MSEDQSLTDVRFNALRTLGFEGHINDMLFAWLSGLVSSNPESLPTAWRDVIVSFTGINPSDYQRNDDWFNLLGLIGFEGNMNDRETAFWREAGQLETQLVDRTTGAGADRTTGAGAVRQAVVVLTI